MYCGVDKYKTPPRITEQKLVLALKSIKESGYPIILLTARKSRYSEETKQQLEALGLSYDVILHAPHAVEEGAETTRSTKGEVLKGYLAALSEKERGAIKRLVVIDDMGSHLSAIESSLSDKQVFHGVLSLNQYSPDTRLLKSEVLDAASRSTVSFPRQLNEVSVSRSLGGGTESTYEVTIEGKPYVLKHGASEEALKMEVLSNVLYRALGVAVPALACYGVIPSALSKRLSLPHTKVAVQLAEKIAANERQSEAVISEQAAKDFVIHAFLGNIDVAKEDNFIVDASGRAILIDSGANFIFRALGEDRSEERDGFDELFTLRDASKNRRGAKWFGGLEEEALKQQALALLSQRDVIEKTVWETVNRLDFSSQMKAQIINGFSHRFEQLAAHFKLDERMYPKPDKKAVEGVTSAGILSLRYDEEGEPMMLLSQRVRHAWWDNFGGKSDKGDKNLAVTASREVLEESSGELYYSPEALAGCPFHEIVTEKEGKRQLYRLYVATTDKSFKLSKLTDHEHTAHRWVKVSELLKALSHPNVVTLEDKETISVELGEGESIALFPPLYDLLKQAPFQALLKSYTDKETHRLKQADFFRRRYVNIKPTSLATDTPAVTPERQVIRALPSVRQVQNEVTLTVLRKEAVLSSIKARGTMNEARPEAPHETPEPPVLSQTECHLKLILGEDYKDTATIKENVEAYLNRYPDFYKKMDRETLVSLCVTLIEEERKHPDEIIFYHGCSDKVAYAYEIYTALYQLLKSDRRYDSFRSEHPLFKRLQDVGAFIDYYQQKGGGQIDNYSDDYMALALSCNFFLFGNHKTDTSHTLSYFINNDARSDVDLGTLLEVMFKPLGIPEGLIQELNSHYQHSPYQGKGMLYQLRLPKALADKYAYASGFMGKLKPSPLGRTHTPSQVLAEMRESMSDETKKHRWQDYIGNLQARLMAPPEVAIQTVKRRYDKGSSGSEAKVAAFDKRLKNLVKQMAHHYLYESGTEHSTKESALPLLKQKKAVMTSLGIMDAEEKKVITREDIQALIDKHQVDDLKALVRLHPTLLTDTLPSRKRRHYTREYYGGSGAETNKTLLDLLIDAGHEMTECLYQLYGEDFYEKYKGDKSNVYKHLRPCNYLDYLQKSDGWESRKAIKGIYETLRSTEKQAFLSIIKPAIKTLDELCLLIKRPYWFVTDADLTDEDVVYLVGLCEELIKDESHLVRVLEQITKSQALDVATQQAHKLMSTQAIQRVIGLIEGEPNVERFLDSIKDKISHIDDLKKRLSGLSIKHDMQEKILVTFSHLIQNKNDFFTILPLVVSTNKLMFIRRHTDCLNDAADVIKMLKWVSMADRFQAFRVHREKISRFKHIRQGLLLLSENDKLAYLTMYRHSVSHYDHVYELAKCITHRESRLTFIQSHLGLIKTIKQVSAIVSLLAEQDQLPFAEAHQHLIKQAKTLYQLLSVLTEAQRAAFKLTRSYSLYDVQILLKILKLLNQGERLKLLKENIDLVIQAGLVDEILLLCPEARYMPQVLAVLSEVHDVRDLLNYLRALPQEAQYKTLVEHIMKIKTIHELNSLLSYVPEQERLLFISLFDELIVNVSDLVAILPSLPEPDRIRLIHAKLNVKVKKETALLLAGYLAIDDIVPFLQKQKVMLRDEKALLVALEYLPEIKKIGPLSYYLDNITSPKQLCKVLRKLPVSLTKTYVPMTVYSLSNKTILSELVSLVGNQAYTKQLLLKNQHLFRKMSCEELLTYLMVFPTIERASFAPTLLSLKPTLSELAKLLRLLTPNDALKSLQSQADRIKETKAFITLLCQLPSEMRRAFHPSRSYTPDSPKELLFLVRSLPEEPALALCTRYADAINNETLFLDVVGNLPESCRTGYVEKYIDKIESEEGAIACLKLMSPPVSEALLSQEKFSHPNAWSHLLTLLPEEKRLAYFQGRLAKISYADIDNNVLMSCAQLLPDSDRVTLAHQYFFQLSGYERVKGLRLLPLAARSVFVKPSDDFVKSNLARVIELLPEEEKRHFLTAYKGEIGQYTLQDLIPALPFADRMGVLHQYEHEITDGWTLIKIAPSLPEAERLPFIQRHRAKIKYPIQLRRLMSSLSQEARLKLVAENEHFIEKVDDAADIAALLPEEMRMAFINKRVEKVKGALSGYMLEKIIVALPVSERESFFRQHSEIFTKYTDLKHCIRHFSDTFRKAFTQSIGIKIHISNLKDFLSCLPTSERYAYALKYDNMVVTANLLSGVIETLPEDLKLDFLVRYEELIQSSKDLSLILNAFSKKSKQRVAEMYHDKMTVDSDFLDIRGSVEDQKQKDELTQLLGLTQDDINLLVVRGRHQAEIEDWMKERERDRTFYDGFFGYSHHYNAAPPPMPTLQLEGYQWDKSSLIPDNVSRVSSWL